jgi:PhnB protein
MEQTSDECRAAQLSVIVGNLLEAPLNLMETYRTTITPVLTVRNATEAVAFYQRAFGADELHRNTYPDGRIVVEMAIESARFRVADEAPESSNLSPGTLGGTTVRINLLVAEPDRLATRAVANGATQIAPMSDQSYGLRQGRFADPYGHHWLIGRAIPGIGDWAIDHRD